MKNRQTKQRMQFIDEIKARIVDGVPKAVGDEKATRAAIARWEAGEDAQTPFEQGVFAMCEQVRNAIERA